MHVCVRQQRKEMRVGIEYSAASCPHPLPPPPAAWSVMRSSAGNTSKSLRVFPHECGLLRSGARKEGARTSRQGRKRGRLGRHEGDRLTATYSTHTPGPLWTA